ncbi:MAG TPA: carbon-nitrogen hydrolase [Polyangiaceae bacterium]|nr:carbon-nitrogen hydrolase [Polyangiaceae bacterium]
MTKHSLKIGMIQTRVGLDKAENVQKTSAAIRDAAARGATLICLQELFATQYFCQTEDAAFFDLAEASDGPTVQAIAKVAKECKVSVVTPFFERRAPGVYHNSVVVVGPQGNTVGLYRKMHIPDDPLFMEKYYFTPGDLGFQSFDTPDAKVGTLICWDQWYPEAARLTAMRGSELLTYPTAIGWHPSEKEQYGAAQLSAWQTIQRSHAIANGVFVIAVNRVGHEGPADGGIEFWGHSFVADPFGVVLAEAGQGEETLVVECDLTRPEWVRRNWPFFRDRRIDAYGDLTHRFLDSNKR